MDAQPIAGRDDTEQVFKQALSMFGAPAYMRRAARVEAALQALLTACRRQRDEWSLMLVVRLVTLRGLAGEWERLMPFLTDAGQMAALQRLWDELQPEVLVRIEPTTSPRKLRRALAELVQEIETVNRRWDAYLASVDITEVNRQRDGYNRWYILEKECAVRSMAVARQGFVPMAMMAIDELREKLPPLPLPRLS
jgi:hypothetical protein